MIKKIQTTSIMFGLIVGMIILPMILFLNHVGRTELDYPVLAALVAIAFAIRGRWELRAKWWFWLTMTVIVGFHALIVLLVPWKSGWVPAPLTILFCIVDLAIIFGVINLIEKQVTKSAGARSAS